MNAEIVYGFNMGNGKYGLNWDMVYALFPDYEIYEYASEVIRDYLCDAVYGIVCQLDRETGHATIEEDKKIVVRRLYDAYLRHIEKHPELMDKPIVLGFHKVVSGDYETRHDPIILDADIIASI